MSDIAIRIEGLSKSYQLGQAAAIGTLRDTLMDMARAPFRRVRSVLKGEARSKGETIWALRDVSCEIKHGEIVGVIGRNGAGKSTLLKILSRITDPTAGIAEVRGRVGPCLSRGGFSCGAHRARKHLPERIDSWDAQRRDRKKVR